MSLRLQNGNAGEHGRHKDHFALSALNKIDYDFGARSSSPATTLDFPPPRTGAGLQYAHDLSDLQYWWISVQSGFRHALHGRPCCRNGPALANPPPPPTPNGIDLPGFGDHKVVNNVTNETQLHARNLASVYSDGAGPAPAIKPSHSGAGTIIDIACQAQRQWRYNANIWAKACCPMATTLTTPARRRRPDRPLRNATYALTDQFGELQAGARIAKRI